MSRRARLLLLGMAGLWVGCERAGAPGPPAEGTGPAANDGYVESSDDVHLYYRVVGTGGDTVIVLHGGPGFSMEYFAEDLVPLAERHTLIFYDQRGAGRSTLVSDSTLLDAEWWAEDLEAVRRYFDLGRVTLLGHSWGASVAALYLTRYPRRVERLLVVGGTPLTRWELTRAFEELAEGRGAEARDRLQRARDVWLSDPGDAEACRAYYAEWFVPFFSVSGSAERSRGDFCAGPPEALRNKVNAVDRFTSASLGDWDWRGALEDVTVRLLILHGTADPLPLEGACQWTEAIPGARVLFLEGIGHFPYVEAPEAFFGATGAFLDGGWPEGARTAEDLSGDCSDDARRGSESSNGRGAMTDDHHVHHEIDYVEFTVHDMDEARRFYGLAFGWEFNDYGEDYSGIRRRGGGEAGGLRLDTTVTTGGPLVILYSDDLEDTLGRVREAGGEITVEPFGFPGGRRFHFRDPSGNELAVWSER